MWLVGRIHNNGSGIIEEFVDITIYPETGYSRALFVEYLYLEGPLYSEGKSDQKYVLRESDTFFDELGYERGYNYKVNVLKTTHVPPLLDGPSFEYEFVRLISKEITAASQQELVLIVSPYLVRVQNILSKELKPSMLANVKGIPGDIPIEHIEGFVYEKGFSYEIKVLKSIKVNPYSETYSLV